MVLKPESAAVLVATVLAVLALLHIRWGVVGVSGHVPVIPEVDGRPLFVPDRTACFAVAAALLLGSWVLLVRAGHLPAVGVPWLGVAGTAVVGVVLVLRAIGDFRYVGFFKRIHGSTFATMDSRYFSPLCLALGLLALWAAFGRPGVPGR